MKALIENRTSFWRAVVFGGAASAMLLAGCTVGSRGLFSRSFGRKDDGKVAAKTPEKDPFLDADIERAITLSERRYGETPRRSRDVGEVTAGRRRELEIRRSILSERFEQNRVAAARDAEVGESRGSDGSPFPEIAADGPSSRPFPELPRGGGDPFADYERRQRLRQLATGRSRRVERVANETTIIRAANPAAPFPHATTQQRGGVTPASGNAARPDAIEIQIIPRDTAPPTPPPVRKRVRPGDLKRTAEPRPPAAADVVQISATRSVPRVIDGETQGQPQWRSLPPLVDRPLPSPGGENSVGAETSADGASPLPFPTQRERQSRASQPPAKDAAVAVADDAADGSADAATSPFAMRRWMLAGLGLLATVYLVLRRRRATAA